MDAAERESIPRRAMGMLADLVPLDAAVFYTVDANGEAVDHELFRLGAECLGEYRERFHRLDPCHPRRFGGGGETLVRLRDLLEPGSFVRSEYYRDFFRRIGVRHEVELFLHDRGRIVAGLSLLRSPRRGEYADREIDALTQARPFVELAISGLLHPRSLDAILAADFALTDREIEVVRRLVAGARNEEIAKALFVSLPTVKTHLRHVFDKMDVRSRTELAARVHALAP
jgi:DNA-binding CsgD family transcriptional regulator